MKRYIFRRGRAPARSANNAIGGETQIVQWGRDAQGCVPYAGLFGIISLGFLSMLVR